MKRPIMFLMSPPGATGTKKGSRRGLSWQIPSHISLQAVRWSAWSASLHTGNRYYELLHSLCLSQTSNNRNHHRIYLPGFESHAWSTRHCWKSTWNIGLVVPKELGRLKCVSICVIRVTDPDRIESEIYSQNPDPYWTDTSNPDS